MPGEGPKGFRNEEGNTEQRVIALIGLLSYSSWLLPFIIVANNGAF